VIVTEALSTEFSAALPWELLYANDLVVTAETEDNLIKRLNECHARKLNKEDATDHHRWRKQMRDD